MKLTKDTKEVLKTFANINSNIAIGEGDVLRTVAISKNLMGKASCPEEFPYKFGIYDLPEFLSCINMFDDPELTFDESKKFVNITDGISSIKYFFSPVENLTISERDIDMATDDVTFTITADQMASIRKASGALKSNDLVVTKNTEGGTWIKLTVTDKDNPTSNEFDINIANCNINIDSEFEFVFDINNFKFNNADEYVFGISTKLISSVQAGNTQFWVALAKTSKV